MEMLLMSLVLAASPVISSPIHSGVVAAGKWVKEARCDSALNAVHVVTVLADDKPVFETWKEFEVAYAGRATYELLGAFVSGTKVMLLQQLSVESGMKGPSESATFISLSPVLDLAP
ncbi:hypothetical protein JYJ95_33625 [Corallococcus exiguus]|uniref:hypothetical protein n=1 Tax=Corallococcus exiguus TaxID=83462 RepID=UPI001A8C747B|nr:hypothetical protein [Corallococcus exiguus]MBN8471473.1 hypothetical protein [Corallococcus exiguus]